MSLGLVVVVREGIIITADSRTTSKDQANQLRIATDFTDKVFRCGRFGIVTAGWNTFGAKSIGQHMETFCSGHKSKALSEAAGELADFFLSLYSDVKKANPQLVIPPSTTIVEFLIAGFDDSKASAFHVLIYEPDAQNTTGKLVRQTILPDTASAAWVGSSEFVQRLVNGFSTSGQNLTAEQIATLPHMFRATNVPFVNFTLQDALNFAVFMIEVTMKMQRFTQSKTHQIAESANVGGELEVAKITQRDGFDWVQHKKLEVVSQLSPDGKISPLSNESVRRPAQRAKKAR